MCPLRKRIAYKKKSKFNAGKYILILVLIVVAIYLLFYHRFEKHTIYERAIGFFKSEIEKSTDITIVDADKEVKKIIKGEPKKDNAGSNKGDSTQKTSEKDEIEEVIKKKLEGR